MRPKTSGKEEGVPKSFRVALFQRDGCPVNLAGDYQYLTVGYYISQDLEADGQDIHPTCKESLDADVVPLCLEKARQAGLPIPEYYITNDYFEPPVIIDPINPFMDRQRIVLRPGSQEGVAKSLTRNFTYPMCCQVLPKGARVAHFRGVLGWSTSARYRTLAALLWEAFRIPLATVRVLAVDEETVLLSRLKPLPFERLTLREREYIDKAVIWQT